MTRHMTWLGPTKSIDADAGSLTIRLARPDDAPALEALAELDSQRAPRGAVLVADVDGALWAAVSLDDHHAVADPFRLSGELVFLLHERARQLRRSQRASLGGLPRVWPAAHIDGVG
jgi:hypothetical protein